MSVVNVPVGFRFNPTESDLACHYLYNRVMGYPLSCPHVVKDYDLYGQEEPWEVWDKFEGSNHDYYNNEEDDDDETGRSSQDLFFYTMLKRRKPNNQSSKFERGVGSNGGRWHGDALHTFHSKGVTWNRRRYRYKNPNTPTTDASWIMMEYSLDESLMLNAPHYTVLCRIRRKKNKSNCGGKRKSAQSNPQPKPVKDQLKKSKLELRTLPPAEETVQVMEARTLPPAEETVQVTAPPPHFPVQVTAHPPQVPVQVTATVPHVPVDVPLSRDLLHALNDSCFNEKQMIAIDSLFHQMKARAAKGLKESNASTPVEEIIQVTTPPVDASHDVSSSQGDINLTGDGSFGDLEEQGEEEDVNFMDSTASASSLFIPLEESDLADLLFHFQDCDTCSHI